MRRLVLTLVFLLPGVMSAQSTTPEQLLNRAMDEQQKGELTAAIRDYRRYLTERPNTFVAHANLGAALAHSGNLDAAIAEYEAALKIDPQQPGAHLDLGLAYTRKGDLEDALPQFEAAHRANPQDARTAILLGDAEARTGRAADAVAMLLPLEPANADNSDFEYVLGEALIANRRSRDGASRMEKSAEMSRNAESWMIAGSALLDAKDFGGARRDLDRAMALNPDLPGLCTLDGTARDKDGDAKAAEPVFREALRKNPDDFEANLYLGAILYNQRNMEESKQYLQKALQLNPKSNVARYETAMWLSTSGQYADAVQVLEKLTADDPNWLDPHVELAALYYRLHRPEDGKRERAIVDKITAEQQQQGPDQ